MKQSNSKYNSLLEVFGAVSVRKVNGRILLSPVKKRSNPTPTENQKAGMNRFTTATMYAKRQMLDPERAAMYAAGINAKMPSAYVVAVKDALTAPTVEEICTDHYNGRAGDIISIRAHDDFKVVRVSVSIQNKNGEFLEQGDAVIDEFGSKWNYEAKVANPDPGGTKIIATAFDYPMNKGTLEKVLEQSLYQLASLVSKRTLRKLHPHNLRITKSAFAGTAMADKTKITKRS